MTPTIEFFVAGIPKPAGSKRGFAIKKGGQYTGSVAIVDASKGSKDWKADVRAAAKAAYTGTLLTGPLAVNFFFRMQRPLAHFGSGANSKVLKLTAPKVPTTMPDLLKLARGVEDALSGIIYEDDSQITSEFLVKRYGETPGVRIIIQPEL